MTPPDDTSLGGPSAEANLDHTPAEPRAEDSNAIDTALDDAGVQDDPTEPVVDPPVVDPPVVDPPEVPVVDPPKIDPPATEPVKPELKVVEDLDGVRPQPGTSPANIANFDALRHTAKHFKSLAESVPTLEARIKELEARQPEIPPEVKEAMEFKAIFDLEHDPDFKSKYDEPLKQNLETFYGLIKSNGGDDALIKQIEDAGGPLKLRSKWIQDEVLPKMSLMDGEKLKKSLLSLGELTEGRAKELEDNSGKREELLQRREAKQKESFEQEQGIIKTTFEALSKELSWTQRVTVSPTATEAEKKAAEEHNKNAEQIERIFNNALYPETPEQRTQVALAAAMSDRLAALCQVQENHLNALQADKTRLETELSKLKGAGKLPPSIPGARPPIKVDPLKVNVDSEDAIEAGLLEAGA